MAKVKIEEIINHLDFEIRNALEDALKKHFPKEKFNIDEVFDSFTQEVYLQCSTWESVPDRYVKKE